MDLTNELVQLFKNINLDKRSQDQTLGEYF